MLCRPHMRNKWENKPIVMAARVMSCTDGLSRRWCHLFCNLVQPQVEPVIESLHVQKN